MKVTFLLPGAGDVPSGGFKVVYEYANGLVARGHELTVCHTPTTRREYGLLFMATRGVARYVGRLLGLWGGYRPDAWFRLNPSVRVRWLPSFRPLWVPDSDIVVATAWQTAEWVSEYPERKGRQFYLIQHKESISSEVEPVRVMDTWRLPMEKVVISRWLQNIAFEMGERATYIPNGLNFDEFGLDLPIPQRKPESVIMLYGREEWKGSAQGLDAIRLLRREFPRLRATVFGVPERPKCLPYWISYYRKPSRERLRKLYNEAAIFIGPSWSEGWGLPGCEAAQCGAALCVTDNGGHREYAHHEHTALLSPPGDAEALAANAKRLIQNDSLRIRLATEGNTYVQRFTWERAVEALEQLFVRTLEGARPTSGSLSWNAFQ